MQRLMVGVNRDNLSLVTTLNELFKQGLPNTFFAIARTYYGNTLWIKKLFHGLCSGGDFFNYSSLSVLIIESIGALSLF